MYQTSAMCQHCSYPSQVLFHLIITQYSRGRCNTIQMLQIRGESERVRKQLKVTQLRSDRAPFEPRQSASET